MRFERWISSFRPWYLLSSWTLITINTWIWWYFKSPLFHLQLIVLNIDLLWSLVELISWASVSWLKHAHKCFISVRIILHKYIFYCNFLMGFLRSLKNRRGSEVWNPWLLFNLFLYHFFTHSSSEYHLETSFMIIRIFGSCDVSYLL